MGGADAARGRVLLVHHDAGRRGPIAATMSGLGFDVVEAATPVEAIWELENGPMDFRAALVARELGPSHGRDMLRFISLRYPGVTRVLFGRAAGLPGHDMDADHADAVLDDADAGGLSQLFKR